MQLHSLLEGAHAFLSPPAALDGLTAEHAAARVSGSSHSIAEIVAHMAFWQRWFLDRCDGVAAPVVAQARLGWPDVANEPWEAIRDSFQAGFARALAMAGDEARVATTVSPPIEFGPLAGYTIRDALTHVALHNAHHLGQIVTLRQQLGAWPPPAGSWTW